MAKVPLPGKDVLTSLHKKHGRRVFSNAIDRLLPLEEGAKPTMVDRLAKFMLLRIATRTLPGAIAVGCGLAAKHLHSKHKARKASAAKDAVVDVTPRNAAGPKSAKTPAKTRPLK